MRKIDARVLAKTESTRTRLQEFLAGRPGAGQLELKAIDRHRADVAKTDWPWEFDIVQADKVVRWIERLPHVVLIPSLSGLRAGPNHEWKCAFCGRSDTRLEKDHIVPYSRGGGSDSSNIRPLCPECHSRRTKLQMKSFRREARKKKASKTTIHDLAHYK